MEKGEKRRAWIEAEEKIKKNINKLKIKQAVGRLVGWSVGRLVGWSVGRLVGWSVGRLGYFFHIEYIIAKTSSHVN